MKRLLLFLSLAVAAFGAHAQYATVPDANFRSYLINAGYGGCLSGTQLDTTCPAVTNATKINCSSYNIADLTGIQYFDNLDTLICATNAVLSLPPLPNHLVYFNCDHNSLVTLPPLPSTLGSLSCEQNSLTDLGTLPDGLHSLNCNHNQIGTLPGLPSGFDSLRCSFNPLTALPALPGSLLYLECGFDHLTALPTLPSTLVDLECYNNQLTELPTLPSSLVNLSCGSNFIPALPTLPSSLVMMDCANNLLTALPALPSSMNQLGCYDNQLTALPDLPSSLVIFNCSNNQLAALPVLPAGVHYVYCHKNQLTALPALPASVYILDCSRNLLTGLPPLPNALQQFKCSNNHLTSLPTLPSSLSSFKADNNPELICMPVLEHFTGTADQFDIDSTGITCLPNAVQHAGFIPVLDTLPLCGSYGCGATWNIAGRVYRDDNGNCAADTGEHKLQNVKLQLFQGGALTAQVYSNGAGYFSFDESLGSYETRVDTTGLPFAVSCPVDNSHASLLTASDSMDAVADFALQCKPGYDLAVNSLCHTAGMFFPNHQATVQIHAGDLVHYYNASCNTEGLSGTVSAVFSGPAHVVAASGNYTIAGNVVTWNVPDLSQADFFNGFSLVFLTDTFPPQGSQLCLTVTVTADSGTDNNPANDTLTQCFNVVNSFDPNFKDVHPQHLQHAGDWLTYTVHFQNTGTAAAQHVVVLDTLDANLDWSSFQLLAASHPNQTEVKQNGVVRFDFQNIGLPDSSTNEPASHGWIQYRVKAKSDVNPFTAVVHNTASIYFDFNSPVQTNDALVSPATGVATVTRIGFELRPNPSTDEIVVTVPASYSDATLVITDLSGRRLAVQPAGATQTHVRVDALPCGTYAVLLRLGDKTIAAQKLVVVR